MGEHAQRFPPPLARPGDEMTPPFIECGQRVRLRGTLVECIRRKGHPVRLNFAHSNGYQEWAFDEDDTPGTTRL